MKVCSKCRTEKSPSEFSVRRRSPDGLRKCCKTCDAAYYWANREKILRAKSDYYEANREQLNAKNAANYKKTRQKVLARVISYYKANRAKVVAYKAERYRSNPEKERARTREWKLANPEKVRVMNRLRRAKKLNAEGSHTESDIKRLFELQRGKCAGCRASIKSGYHVDHVIALANGGSNWPDNLQLLCPTCNAEKFIKHPVDFMQQKGFLL